VPASQREHPEVVSLRQRSARHREREAEARDGLATTYINHVRRAIALEESLADISPSYRRIHIGRCLEVSSLAALGVAETVVADSVVQSLGFTAVATDLVSAAVGVTATGLAWLAGHEWAIAHDPQAAMTGRRGWKRLAVWTSGAFLAANFAVRVYYGVLAGQGGGLVAPVLSAALLTVVTAALMLVGAFISANAETSQEAALRGRLRRVRREIREITNRVGVLESVPVQELPPAEADGPPPVELT
jgi:hypothetical protein